MTASLLQSQTGHRNKTLSRSDDGERIYKVTHVVETDDTDDGPQTVLNTPGLPLIGSSWSFGNDFDLWAFCTPQLTIKALVTDEPNNHWTVEQTFSTIRRKTCEEETIEDPLLEPDKVNGGFSRFTEEIFKDRFGNPITTSSHELVRGPQVEFDKNRPNVTIAQNVASLGLATFTDMIDTVNDATLWGLGARKIKLSNVTWSRNIYGTCNYYYTRTFEFETNFKTFDRSAMDEGTKVLRGSWNSDCTTYTAASGTDKNNPLDFVRFKDCNGENSRVILDGNGLPIDRVGTGTGTFNINPGEIPIEHYEERNFLLLGIPTVIDL